MSRLPLPSLSIRSKKEYGQLSGCACTPDLNLGIQKISTAYPEVKLDSIGYSLGTVWVNFPHIFLQLSSGGSEASNGRRAKQRIAMLWSQSMQE